MPRFHRTIPIDDYVLDVLMRDIVGHDQQPAAFLVYLYLSGRAARQRWQPVKSSLRMLADETGLSKSAVQTAIAHLRRRALVSVKRDHVAATPRHRVLRPGERYQQRVMVIRLRRRFSCAGRARRFEGLFILDFPRRLKPVFVVGFGLSRHFHRESPRC